MSLLLYPVSSSPIWLGARVTGPHSVTMMWSLPADSGGSAVQHWMFEYEELNENTTLYEVKVRSKISSRVPYSLFMVVSLASCIVPAYSFRSAIKGALTK